MSQSVSSPSLLLSGPTRRPKQHWCIGTAVSMPRHTPSEDCRISRRLQSVARLKTKVLSSTQNTIKVGRHAGKISRNCDGVYHGTLKSAATGYSFVILIATPPTTQQPLECKTLVPPPPLRHHPVSSGWSPHGLFSRRVLDGWLRRVFAVPGRMALLPR